MHRLYYTCIAFPFNVVRTRSQFHVVSPIALNIVSSSTVTRYINLSSSRDRRSRFPFLVALSNDVQSYVYLVAQRFFLSSLRTYTHKKNTHKHTHRYGENKHEEQRWYFENLSRQEKKRGMYTTRDTHTNTYTHREKHRIPWKMEGHFFMLRCWEDVYAHLVTHVVNNRAVSGDACGRFASKGNSIAGEESDGTPGTPSSVYLRVNRRRTDLMPTIPSPRDGPPTSGRSSSAKAFTRSPGRTYSMSRLDQLAQPRKRPTELSTLTEQQSQPLSASSMSRSMSHLAASGGKSLKRSDNSRSMGTLPGAVPMPRPTRAERLRRKAREHQNQQQQGKIVLVHSTRWYSLSIF